MFGAPLWMRGSGQGMFFALAQPLAALQQFLKGGG